MSTTLVEPASALARAGGWLVVPCVSPAFLPYLVRESCRASLQLYEDRSVAAGTGRGDPDRWLLRATGGDALDTLYQTPGMVDVLTTLTGRTWERAGDHASYAYYCREGHYLGRHRDADDCDLAVITCLRNEQVTAGGTSGLLRLHTDPVVDLRLTPGDTLVFLGGTIEHEVLALAADHVRVITALCFQPASATSVELAADERDEHLVHVVG